MPTWLLLLFFGKNAYLATSYHSYHIKQHIYTDNWHCLSHIQASEITKASTEPTEEEATLERTLLACFFSSCIDSRELTSKADKKKEASQENGEGNKEGRSRGSRRFEIMELVENKEVFGQFVEHKFEELDRDKDGQLSAKEFQPAVADIGAAQGSSPDSDHIYSEVLF